MPDTQPGDRRPDPGDTSRGRLLERPPSERYGVTRPGNGEPASPGASTALAASMLRAGIVAVAGALGLVLVGAVFASTAGLLPCAGVTGGAIGLVLARAAVPGDGRRPVSRRTLGWLAGGISLGAVVAAAVATWLIAQREGGTLGLLDYLGETFGLVIPAEALIAGLAALWGTSSGPIQS